MIQRIQTVYLIIATFLMALLLTNPISQIVVSDNLFLTLWHNKIVGSNPDLFTNSSTWPITVLLVVIILIEAVVIFLYKNRNLQLRLTVFNLLLMFGLVGLIYFFTRHALNSTNALKNVFLWPIVCPMVSIILNYLAIKAIQKDDNLIKSYDRIR